MFKYLKYLSLLPNVIQFIMAAEEVFRSVKAGQVKREYVLNAISNLFSMLTSTGVLKQDDVAILYPRSGELVDLIVGFLNDFGVFKRGS